MGDVVNFPGKMQLNDAELRQAIHEALIAKGYTVDVSAKVCDRVMPLIQEARRVIARGISFSTSNALSEAEAANLTASVSEAVQGYQREVGENALKLIVLLALEMANRLGK